MKKFTLLILALIVFGNPITGSSAQLTSKRKPTFYVNSGFAYTLAPSLLERFWKRGFTMGGGIGVPIDSRFSAVGYINYNILSFDSKGLIDPRTGGPLLVTGSSISIFTISLNLKTKAIEEEKRIAPYFITGTGLFKISGGDMTSDVGSVGLLTLAGTDEEYAISFTFGLGVDFKIRDTVNLFAEGRAGIGTITGNKVIYLPLKIGLSFQSK